MRNAVKVRARTRSTKHLLSVACIVAVLLAKNEGLLYTTQKLKLIYWATEKLSINKAKHVLITQMGKKTNPHSLLQSRLLWHSYSDLAAFPQRTVVGIMVKEQAVLFPEVQFSRERKRTSVGCFAPSSQREDWWGCGWHSDESIFIRYLVKEQWRESHYGAEINAAMILQERNLYVDDHTAPQ